MSSLLPIIPDITQVVSPAQLQAQGSTLSNVSPDSNVAFAIGEITPPLDLGAGSIPAQRVISIEVGFDTVNPCSFQLAVGPDSNVSNITQYSRTYSTALSNVPISASCSLVVSEGVDYLAGSNMWIFISGTSNVPTFDSNVTVVGSALATSLP